jgi:hypothetical protein
MRLEHPGHSLMRKGLTDSENFGTRGSEEPHRRIGGLIRFANSGRVASTEVSSGTCVADHHPTNKKGQPLDWPLNAFVN